MQSFVALAFVAALVVILVLLVNAFRDNNRKIECLESGRRECVPLDTAAKGRR